MGNLVQPQRMEHLLEISRELTSTVSLERLLHQIVEAAVELTGTEAASLLLLDEASGELRFVAASSFVDQLMEIPVPVEASIAGAAFGSGKPVIVPDVRIDERYFAFVEEQTGLKARSLLAVPLQFQEHKIGVLEVENKRKGEFGQEDVETLSVLAAQATVAIENARMVEALKQARDDLEKRVDERTAELSTANKELQREVTDRRLAEAMLRESTERFRQIVENAPLGYYRVGRDAAWQYVNPEWVRMHGYELHEVIGQSFEITQPEEDREQAREIVRQAMSGESLSGESRRLRRDGTTAYQTFNVQPVYLYDEIVAIEGFINDITERKQSEEALRKAHDELEIRVQERTKELATANKKLQAEIAERQRAEEAEREQRILAEALRDTATALNSTLDTDEVLDRILINVRQVVPHDVANILLLDEGGQTNRILRVHGHEEHGLTVLPEGTSLRLADIPIYRRMFENQQPVVLPDTRLNPDWVTFPETSWIRSFLCAPMCVQDRVIGFLNLDSATPDFFAADQAQQLQAFADQAAVAIQNASLYSQMESHTRDLEAQVEERTKELQQNVELLWEEITERERIENELRHSQAQLRAILNSTQQAFVLFDRNFRIQTSNTSANDNAETLLGGELYEGKSIRSTVEQRGPEDFVTNFHKALNGETVSIERQLPRANNSGEWFALSYNPVLADENQIVGVCVNALNITERKQAEQALRETAAMAERERLAGDLHDAVTQTLFSASLIAEVLPRLWEIDPTEAERNLGKLRQLTRGALAEMRTLLLELRPAALTQRQLGDLLRHLSETLTSRTKIPVDVTIEGGYPPPPDVQIAVYRIAQEAFNNIAKHAEASQVALILGCQPEGIELCVGDDGRGFDPDAVPPGHLGLDIMRERAEKISATLAIESKVDQGTKVRVVWMKDE